MPLPDGLYDQILTHTGVRKPLDILQAVTAVGADGQAHTRSKPMSIQWQLEVPLPGHFFREFSILRDA